MSHGLRATFVKKYPAGPVIRADEWMTSGQSGITVLFGSSGAGKSTLLRCLAGLERPEEGSIYFGEAAWFDSSQRICLPPRLRHVGYVPQEYGLFPHLAVRENIAYGLKGLPAGQRHSRVAEVMRWLELADLEHRRPGQLSGGQRQRVALGRAVACRPRLLLLDEPLAALDAPTRQRLRGDLRHLLRQFDIPTILVTHDRFEALSLGDDLVVMDQGQMVQRGPIQDVFSRPANRVVAGILAVETIQSACVTSRGDLTMVMVGAVQLAAAGIELPPGAKDVFVCIRAEDVVLVAGALENQPSSPRNRLAATVRALIPEGPMMKVQLDCGFPLMALLTRTACEELSLREGGRVTALIKAPHVHLIPR